MMRFADSTTLLGHYPICLTGDDHRAYYFDGVEAAYLFSRSKVGPTGRAVLQPQSMASSGPRTHLRAKEFILN
jgi:hypothetical protein